MLLRGLLLRELDAGEMQHDGVRSGRQRDRDQCSGDARHQDAGGDRDDDAQRMDRDEPPHQERLQHVTLDLLHGDHAGQHDQRDHDPVVDERDQDRHRPGDERPDDRDEGPQEDQQPDGEDELHA